MRIDVRSPFFRPVLLLFAVVLIACSQPSGNPGGGGGQPSPPTRFNIRAGGSNIIVDLSGDVEIEHSDWIRPVPATFGSVALPSDALYVHGGAQATIVCSDLSPATLSPQPGQIRDICQGETATMEFQGKSIPMTQAPHHFKPIVSPRNTNILAPPTIHLAPPNGTTIEVIEIDGAGVSHRINTNGQTVLPYPADAPPLSPDETYTIRIVQWGTPPSSDLDIEIKTSGFTILSNDKINAIRAAETKIHNLNVSDEAKLVLIANLYLSHKLYADTADLLRGDPATAQQPILSRYLADCYAQMQQLGLAEQHYQHALGLTTNAHLQERAYIYEQQGDIANQSADPSSAQSHWQRSSDLYQQMGHQKKVDELLDKISSSSD